MVAARAGMTTAGAAPADRGAARAAIRAAIAAVLALLGLFATAARAADFPKFTGLVVDAANVIPPDREAALTAKLAALQAKTGRQLVVATVPDLGGQDIQAYGVALLRAWGVGLKDADNGAILLVAPTDRKVGIETGYGVEGVLTDAYSSVVINTKILPAFKAGDLPGGIDAGADALIGLLAAPDDDARAKRNAAVAAWDKAHARGRQDGGGVPWGLVIWLVVIGVFVVGRLGRRGYGRSYGGGGGSWPVWMWGADIAAHMIDRDRGGDWGGGGSFGGGDDGGGGWMGGGFTGGGGGSGGGGGASGSW